MGLTPLKPSEIAAIVTALDMRVPPALKVIPPCPLRLIRWKAPSPEAYRILFKRVGSPWLWFSRLMMTDDALNTIIHDPAVEISAVVDRSGIEVGILELDFRIAGSCEIAFFGFVPELGGKGYGQWLMAHALNMARRDGAGRVWLHTCTLDSPSAFGFYIRHGFIPYERAVETFADPRSLGILPRDCAPHIPLLEASTH